MKRLTTILAFAALALAIAAPTAQASFGLEGLDVSAANEDGSVASQAGSHPFSFTTKVNFATSVVGSQRLLEGEVKDFSAAQIAGLIGSQTAVPTCSSSDFNTLVNEGHPNCPNATAVGIAAVKGDFRPLPPGEVPDVHAALFNLVPPPGVAARLGFSVLGVPITIDVGLNHEPPYNLVATLKDIPQSILIYGSEVTLWGVPASPAHDSLRGQCVGQPYFPTAEPVSLGKCPVSVEEEAFLTLPRACKGPLATIFSADDWANPGAFTDPQSALTHDGLVPPNPQGMSGCDKLGFSPSITAVPTSKAATSPSGLDFSLNFEHDDGLTNPAEEAVAEADVEKAVVTLPEGFSINPSQAEGLAVCSEADVSRETASSEPGTGCPNASKVGTVEVETPLLDETVKGALYVATPYENPEGSLIALYMVLQNKRFGISVHQPLKVETNPVTGQITTVGEGLPELPFSHFKLHFREGTRSPLATPPGCGTYAAQATLYPSSGNAPVQSSSAFQIITGPEAGPCPSGGTPPFHPGLVAGSINNAAGAYSPFNVRIFRNDSEQEITHFSIKLPPGVTGKLAGIPFCSDASIAAAKAREKTPHGGQEELSSPSCPAASEVGHTLVGAGVGPSLAYVPGKVYLAGPYKGSQLSIVAITAAKAGPFDLGTVVVREALRINPETAEVFVDATGSDPIPHIVAGIPVHLRDIRAYVDRPSFVLNPTNCTPTSTASTILGSGTNFASEADDQPVTVTTRYQAADCASLPYKPALTLKLKGSTKRGGTPALTAILRPRAGDANSKLVSVALPHSEFLEQGHIKTVCTRVQFKEGAGNGTSCPAGSIYGHAKAWTPLLSDPLEGPVILRTNPEHELPDLVLALHGLIDFDAVGRIDSFHSGIRNTFEAVPDAPVSKVEVAFQGGKKGLLVNSTNICKGSHKATTKYTAQSGKAYEAKVPLQAQCKGKGKKKSKSKSAARLSALLGALGSW